MEEQQTLLNQRENSNNLNDSFSEDWDGSSYSSYYSDSDSSVPEWESSINESTGETIYIDCLPHVTQTAADQKPKKPGEFPKSQIRQSTRSKFLRLIRRRASKRQSKRAPRGPDVPEAKVTFQDCQEGEQREVTIRIMREGQRRQGRRTTLAESLLGLNLSTLSDGSRIMVAGFTPEAEVKNDKNVKIGDWLKSINNTDVFFENLDAVLEQLKHETHVLLKLQRVAGVEVTKVPPVNALNNQSKFVHDLINHTTEEEEEEENTINPTSDNFGIILLSPESLTENSSEDESVLYSYPRFTTNPLQPSKGIFITLNHLLHDAIKEFPEITTFELNKKLTHVSYTRLANNKKLLLLMAPADSVNAQQLSLITTSVIRFLEFVYQSIERALESGFFSKQIDALFRRFFEALQRDKGGDWFKFEGILPAAGILHLPREAQMQLDDALTELEASDYREWNEDPLDCQRLFTILGSALYHQDYLLLSHLVHEDLVDVNNFCRLQGLFQLVKVEPLKTLILWKEVFPTSCIKGLKTTREKFKIPDGKRYLLVVGSGKQLLAVLMEAGGCTEPPEENTPPDAFYVEEVQATLSHIQELGIPELADRWLAINSEVALPEVSLSKRKGDFLRGFSKSPIQVRDGASPASKKTEVTSILKRRASDQALLSNSTYSLPDDSFEGNSEDSASQGGYSERSEISDEPVLGRRAIREKGGYYGSDDEESDDDYADGSQMSSSSYDLSELRQSLLSESEDMKPLSLTAGEDTVLLHYVHLDTTHGILLCAPENKDKSATFQAILENFRRCSLSIHKLFQNTLKFKNLPAQEMAKSLMNKSLIAVKEHGVCFECPIQDERSKKAYKINFWVIGKLFYMPHPKEIYVCYEDSVPQNITEIAFRLNLTL